MKREFVTRAELLVLLDFIAPKVDANATDGPSQLARGRRESLERELELARAREGNR